MTQPTTKAVSEMSGAELLQAYDDLDSLQYAVSSQAKKDYDRIRAAILKQFDLLTRYKKALEGMTVGGSEFVNDPEYCAKHIQERLHTTQDSLKKAILENQRLSAQPPAASAIDWSHLKCVHCGNDVYLTGICKATWFHKDTSQSGCGDGNAAEPNLLGERK